MAAFTLVATRGGGAKLTLLGLILAGLAGCHSLAGSPTSTEPPVEALSPSAKQLQGSWQLVSLAGADLGEGSRAFLEFAAQPKLTGNGGCNRFFGMYQFGDSGLRIDSSLGSTRMACAASVMMQEERLFQLLPNARRVQLSDGVLVLLDADGVELLRAVPQP